MIRLVRAEQRRDLRCQAGADQHHDDCDRQCPGKRVHERQVCTRDVPAADAHGRDRHTADNSEHDKGIEHHHKRPHQIDRTERVRADALPDEDAVNDRKEKIGAVAENGRQNVLREIFHSDVHSASGHADFRLLRARAAAQCMPLKTCPRAHHNGLSSACQAFPCAINFYVRA